jgi:Holliday junction resolvase
MNSRTKGANGERELAQLLRNQGHMDARRGQQYSGLNGDADVVGLQGVHIECKRVERFTDEPALKQAERDARAGEVPVVIYRRNKERWKVVLRQDIADLIWQVLTADQKQYIYDNLKLRTKLDK